MQYDRISAMTNMAIFLLLFYLSGVSLMWIVCEIHDMECRWRARLHGTNLRPMSFREKLKFSLMWPIFFIGA